MKMARPSVIRCPHFPLTTITLAEAQSKLPELIRGLRRGDELAIMDNGQVVAKLVAGETSIRPLRPPPGLGKGFITIVSDDEEQLGDFAEYTS